MKRKSRKQAGKKDFEISFCEKLIETNPDFVEALICLGNAYTQKGLFNKGLEIDLKLSKLRPYDPFVYYNLSCSYSLLNRVEKSLSCLKKSILLGYSDFEYLVQDRDLDNLCSDYRFKKFFSKINKKILSAPNPV